MSEFLPYQVRALGASIAMFFAASFVAILTFAFPSYVDLVGPKFAWWTFSIIMIIGIVFVVLFFPEARGKSLEEIQQLFENGNILIVDWSASFRNCARKLRLSQ